MGVIGDRRKFLSALVCLRSVEDDGSPTDNLTPTCISFLKENGVNATTVSQAKNDDKGKKLVENGIKAANEKAISRAQNINAFRILDEDFSVNGGELTPTLKLKRRIVDQKYENLIES